jgi:hypothetical protein
VYGDGQAPYMLDKHTVTGYIASNSNRHYYWDEVIAPCIFILIFRI